MKQLLATLATICLSIIGNAQDTTKAALQSLLAELSEGACKCIDSIETANKTKEDITDEINKCINESTSAYQLGKKLLEMDDLKNLAKGKNGKKKINISINMNENSEEYKDAYYEIERYLIDNCKATSRKTASSDRVREKSFSENSEAQSVYSKGIDELKNANYEKALEYFKKAVDIDAEFAFAWDNVGICYRNLGNYDEAINAYKKSLEIDPEGLMPLQNIAIAYLYKKDYDNVIKSYEKLAEVDKDNPEVYYGLGRVYVAFLKETEKGLDNLCKAYNLYIAQKSPYRTDAERLIQATFTEMKNQGKEEKFYEILKANNITPK